ncbi:MAG: PilC/PilY family type IV pilus protein [Dissulfurispiraceae bacterium]|jgi:type IV pilus assembly protein PilY1|nr:PilC/PilY family type IV pilus protein [Dissulfurispiraceae bacterium]
MFKINKKTKLKFLLIYICMFFVTAAYADESELFSTVAPDALIVLDLSGSMDWRPDGGTASTTSLPCTSTSCSRLAIAKTALFNIFDSDNNSLIDGNDEKNLNIRIGYMRFYNCSKDEPSVNYSSGCNTLVYGINTQYTKIYCNKTAPNTCSINTGSAPCIKTESALGGTPLGASLAEAKAYLDTHKSGDPAKACRSKFVIFVTDGEDTYSCGGSGSSGSKGANMTTIAKAKALADNGYKVFVIGFGGNMPAKLKNTLNWAAYYGGTDNPNVENTGNTSAVTIPTNPCSTSIDPGDRTLGGYAFMAEDAAELESAIKQALAMISGTLYTFTNPAVAAIRTVDENYMYEASFQYNNVDPFWQGHLKKFEFDTNNALTKKWDAGEMLANTAASDRKIYTFKSGSITPFNMANITNADLDVATSTHREMIVGYIRGEAAYNPENWKLGDIFHSDPSVIGTPNLYFSDIRDTSNPTTFSIYRENNERSTANGKRIIVAGANDGQLHAFKASNGTEAWSFIPPNLMSRLKLIAHSSHPTSLPHTFFVDGLITYSDVWTGSGDGKSKQVSEWKSYIIFGLGRGGDKTLWSSSASCDSGYNDKYSTTHTNFCGYYALDVTDTLNAPVFKWMLSPNSSDATYFGQPWSKIATSRIKINDQERWIGVIGAGYNAASCASGTCDTRGKGIFIVDLKTGSILKSFTRSTVTGMNYSIPSTPAVVDGDGDGFADSIYIGDLGGNIWKVSLCGRNSSASCGISDWTIKKFFETSGTGIRPVFNKPSLAKDRLGNLWVYWGTGDSTDPTTVSASDKFFAAKDTGASLTLSDLEDITTGAYDPVTSTKTGWYIRLTRTGEKFLAEPDIYSGVVYFTTYVPASGNDPCDMTGKSRLYGVEYITGRGAFPGSTPGTTETSIELSKAGIAKTPTISEGPAGSGASTVIVTSSEDITNVPVQGPLNPRSIKYWKDRRLK